MKWTRLILALVIPALLLAACGGQQQTPQPVMTTPVPAGAVIAEGHLVPLVLFFQVDLVEMLVKVMQEILEIMV